MTAVEERIILNRKCPVCGRRFTAPDDLDDWGPVYETTALCSIPCMRAYEEADFRRSVEKVLEGNLYKTWLLKKSGMTAKQIAKDQGISEGTVGWKLCYLQDVRWKELAWLEEHGGVLKDTDLRKWQQKVNRKAGR